MSVLKSIQIIPAADLTDTQLESFLEMQERFLNEQPAHIQRTGEVPRFDPNAMVAFCEGKPAGFITYNHFQEELLLSKVYVVPAFRNQAIVARMISFTGNYFLKKSGRKPRVIRWTRNKNGKEITRALRPHRTKPSWITRIKNKVKQIRRKK